MKNSPHKYNHKRNKLVRQNMKPPYTPDSEPHNLENIEKHYQKPSLDPKKAALEKHLSQEIDSMKKGMRRKKAKLFKKKRSKRQNSNEVEYETEPEHIHFEGTRWMEVVRKQTIDHGKRLVNKVMKKR
ncbi:MAG: hypothetical protein SNF33_00895 [Candidatus Algichlamydia australiensis]|nr:hypothetical protein [Chlamydiales bacterium]